MDFKIRRVAVPFEGFIGVGQRARQNVPAQPSSFSAKPHSSVSSIADLKTGGCWFDPRLGQYSMQGFMIVIATGFIPLSLLSVVLGKQSVAWKEYCAEYCLKELQESMDRCTGCRNITEILLKTVLNTIQSINLIS